MGPTSTIARGNDRVARRASVIILCALLLIVAGSAQSSAATLFGTVSGQAAGQPIAPEAGASVTVIDPQDGSAVGFATTGLDGGYSITIAPGTYNVRFDPGASGSFASSTVDAIHVDTTRRLDIVLVPAGLTRLSGVLRESSGAPVAGADVQLIPLTGPSTGYMSTGLGGSYSFAVAPGTYALDIAGSGRWPDLPQDWSLDTTAIDVTTDHTLDLTLPTVSTLTVRVESNDGTPIPNAQVNLPSYQLPTTFDTTPTTITSGRWYAEWGLQALTDTNGEVHLNIFDNSNPQNPNGLVNPPTNSEYGPTTFPAPTIQGDTTVVVRFTASSDTTTPTIALSQQPDGGDGWWISSPATAHVTANDPSIAGLGCTVDETAQALVPTATSTTLDADITVSSEGRHAVTCTARDAAGNTAHAQELVRIDLTPPNAPTPIADRAPDFAGRGGWYADGVTVSVASNGDPVLADGNPGSGVDISSVPAPVAYTSSGNHLVSAAVRDLAGLTSPSASLTINVDADPPTSTLTCPGDVILDAEVSARWKDRDGESGLAGPSTGAPKLDTSAIGVHTIEHTATDNVGHTAASSCSFRVVYDYRLAGGLKSPPHFNAISGSPTPVAFSLGGDRGLAIFTPGYPQVQPVSCVDGAPVGPTSPALAAAPLVYAAGTDRYTYSWVSTGVATGTCVALQLGLADGTMHDVWFRR
jgi:carboxypeptidase family protein